MNEGTLQDPLLAFSIPKSAPTILVLGGGAIGALLAGHLTGHGRSVLMADGWEAHVQAVVRSGLDVAGVRGHHQFRMAAATYQQLHDVHHTFDIIFICVKSYDTEMALDLVAPHINFDTIVISTQNGVNEERIAHRVGIEHVVGAVTEIGGVLEGPGQVIETRHGGFVIGELDGSITGRCHALARLMDDCAPTLITSNITGVLWSKLLWNCLLNSLGAITGLGSGRLLQQPPIRRLAMQIASEVGAVAKVKGVDLEPLTFLGVDPSRLVSDDPRVRRAAERELVKTYSDQPDRTTSMVQDIQKGRKTEVDHLNGVVVEMGRILRVPTPINSAVVEMVHAVERGLLKPNLANLDDLLATESQR